MIPKLIAANGHALFRRFATYMLPFFKKPEFNKCCDCPCRHI